MLSAFTVQPNRKIYPAKLLCGEGNCGDAHFACRRGDTFPISVYVPREIGVFSAQGQMISDDGSESDKLCFTLEWKTIDGLYDVWSAKCDVSGLCTGLYFFNISFESVYGTLLLFRFGNGECILSYAEGEGSIPLQLLIYNQRKEKPQWLYGGVIYHIFVDRFCRVGNTPVSEGGILNPDWENGIPEYPVYPGAPLKNNVFFGGNIRGIISKLGYLQTLGVCAIYLSPVFKAASNHKYDIGDYEKIDPGFGTEQDFVELVRCAKAHGIRIILDGVFNHTGDDSKYFNKYAHYDTVGAYQSKQSDYYDWFSFSEFPDKYHCWWDIPILPKLNLYNSSCRNYLFGKDGIIDRWSRYGIGGFRLDVADEIEDDLIVAIKKRMTDIIPDSVLYGEVWEDASNKIAYSKRKHYFEGLSLDGVMNYPLRTGILSYIKYGKVEALKYAIETVMAHCPKDTVHTQMNFLGTHDTKRALTALGYIYYENKTNAEIAKMKMTEAEKITASQRLICAYAAIATLPGIATIYYGDEAGLEGYKDPFNRMPFPYGHECLQIQNAYKAIGKIRRSHDVYKNGAFRLIYLDFDCFAFVRTSDTECLLTVINRESRPMVLECTGGLDGLYPNEYHANIAEIEGGSVCIFSVAGDFFLYRK